MFIFNRISRISVTPTLLAALMFLPFSLVLARAQNVAPRIQYTDLQSGPKSGGKNNLGAFVTIYGNGFGALQGTSTVTVGGVAVANYPLWTDTKITVQLGAVSSGAIVINVGGVASNGAAFTVRKGRIYFVSTTGNDGSRGSYANPWRTILKAKNSMNAGDITYVMNGVTQSTLDANSAAISLGSGGTTGAPKAIIAYPGATVTIGSATGTSYGIRTPSTGSSQWVFAGLTIRAGLGGIKIDNSSDWRAVGNDISCPNGSGAGACVNASATTRIQLLGNLIHDSGSTSATDVVNYASVGFSSANTAEIGWNTIANTRSCRAVSFVSSTVAQYGLKVHDNVIHGAPCDAISLQGTDASQGAVQVYNNVVYRAGTGPAPGGVESSYACVNIGGSGYGTAQVSNNSFYDCGGRAAAGGVGAANSGVITATTPTIFRNNISSVSASESYVTPNTNTSWLSGGYDLFFGAGAAPAPFTNVIDADPVFVDIANGNFRLQQQSPAIDSGTNTGITADWDGVPRPQGSAYDIGAFEYSGPSGNAQLSVTPTTEDFGTLAVGASSTQSFSVVNQGNASTTINSLTVSGAGFSAKGMTLPMTLAPGQSTSYTVTFNPQIVGPATGSAALAATNATAPTVQLSGTAVNPVGTISSSPTSLSFGSVVVGSSASKTVTVTASTASVTISQASTSGAGFSVTGPTLPATLAAGQSATFTVKFAPTVTGGVTGSLSLVSNASNTPSTVSLSGTGAAAAGTLAASPTSLSFGSVVIGSSASKTVTVTASTASVTISQASISGAGFSVTGPTLPATLAAGQSATFTVKFAPTVTGGVTGSLSLVSNASNTPSTVALSGTGAAVISHSAKLTWAASTSSGVVGYNVYRGTVSGGPYTRSTASAVTVTNFTDTAVVAGATYYYVVTAVSSSGAESTYSNQVTAVIPTP